MKSPTMITTALVLSLLLSSNVAYGTVKYSQQGTLERSSWAKEKNELIKQLRDRRQRHEEENRAKSLMPVLKETASLLGMSKEELVQELKQGRSLSDVAQARGMSESELVAKLTALRNQKINEAVIAGKMSAEKAERMKAYLKDHLVHMVKMKGMRFFQHDGLKSMRHKTLNHFNPERMAAMIGISDEGLSQKLQEGKSLVEIAEANGISKEQWKALLDEEARKLLSL